jgi:hypothetical protein
VTTARAPLSIEAGCAKIVLIFGICQARTFDRPGIAERPLNLFTIFDSPVDAILPPERRSPRPRGRTAERRANRERRRPRRSSPAPAVPTPRAAIIVARCSSGAASWTARLMSAYDGCPVNASLT